MIALRNPIDAAIDESREILSRFGVDPSSIRPDPLYPCSRAFALVPGVLAALLASDLDGLARVVPATIRGRSGYSIIAPSSWNRVKYDYIIVESE